MHLRECLGPLHGHRGQGAQVEVAVEDELGQDPLGGLGGPRAAVVGEGGGALTRAGRGGHAVHVGAAKEAADGGAPVEIRATLLYCTC